MTREDTKQAILGFTEFFKGITGNQDLKIPDDIAKEYGIEQEPCTDAISRQAVLDALCEMLHDCFGADDEELDAVITTLNELPPVTPEPNRCNQCKYYEGVHKVQGHAPCSFLKCGGVLWDWYCSNYEPYKEDEENGIN